MRLLTAVTPVVIAALLAVMAPAAARAQEEPPPPPPEESVPETPPEVEAPQPGTPMIPGAALDPRLFKVNRRPPVPFKPFEPVDPTTGKAAPRQTTLTLPDGRRIAADRYYEELNRLEKEFNALGYSLRDPQPEVRLQETVVDRAKLRRDAQALRSSLKPARFPKVTSASLRAEHREAARDEARRLAAAAQKASAAPQRWYKQWSWSSGDPRIFSAYLNGSMDLSGAVDTTKVYGVARAGGSVFGTPRELVGATANLNAPKTGTMTANLQASVLGTTLVNVSQSTPVSWEKDGRMSKSLDFHTSVYFSLGPIPVNVRVGVRGTGSFEYDLSLTRVSAFGRFQPALSSSAYIQAGVDIGIGGVAAGADMVLIDLSLDLYGKALFDVDPQGRAYIQVKTYCYEDLTALQGSVYVKAWIWVPSFPKFKKKTWRNDLWESDGITASGNLFSEDRKLYL